MPYLVALSAGRKIRTKSGRLLDRSQGQPQADPQLGSLSKNERQRAARLCRLSPPRLQYPRINQSFKEPARGGVIKTVKIGDLLDGRNVSVPQYELNSSK